MKHITSLASGVALGSAGIAMMSILSGCESSQQEQVAQNKFLVIEQQTSGKYVVVEEMPTDGPSRAIIRERDEFGNVRERFMSEEEMKVLANQEYKKVQDGTSETVTSNDTSAGMGLGGTILAAAAGALMGNMIANALMNNKKFSTNAANANKSAYSRSANPRANAGKSTRGKSHFGSSNQRSSQSNSNFGG